jgi:hypothetical protein
MEAAGVWMREAAAVEGQRREAALEVRLEPGEPRGRAGARFEDHQRADVHVRGVVGLLQLEEGRVKRCQPVADARSCHGHMIGG